jgi:hypothetical protein
MADEIDLANARAEADTERAIALAREEAAQIPPGEAGDCDYCGEWSGRLVGGACAPCRDRYRIR